MARAKRARKAETPTQPSLSLMLRAPYFYPPPSRSFLTEYCPHCGGNLKIIAAIEEPGVIARILAHLGLPTRAPPRPPARSFDLFATA